MLRINITNRIEKCSTVKKQPGQTQKLTEYICTENTFTFKIFIITMRGIMLCKKIIICIKCNIL